MYTKVLVYINERKCTDLHALAIVMHNGYYWLHVPIVTVPT